jgi:hypothetical protein
VVKVRERSEEGGGRVKSKFSDQYLYEHYQAGLSDEEIASRVGQSRYTVQSRIRKYRKEVSTIFLDLDGTLVNLVHGLCWNLQLDYETVMRTWPLGEYDLTKVLGPTVQFEGLTTSFWASLIPTPNFKMILEVAGHCGTIKFISTVPGDFRDSSFRGKKEWLRRNLNVACPTIFSPAQPPPILFNRDSGIDVMVKPNCVLVDDYDRNIQEVEMLGGRGVLVPRVWNSRHREVNDYGKEKFSREVRMKLRGKNYE